MMNKVPVPGEDMHPYTDTDSGELFNAAGADTNPTSTRFAPVIAMAKEPPFPFMLSSA